MQILDLNDVPGLEDRVSPWEALLLFSRQLVSGDCSFCSRIKDSWCWNGNSSLKQAFVPSLQIVQLSWTSQFIIRAYRRGGLKAWISLLGSKSSTSLASGDSKPATTREAKRCAGRNSEAYMLHGRHHWRVTWSLPNLEHILSHPVWAL